MGAEGGRVARMPQSAQSEPRSHMLYSAPGPPSSQSSSRALRHWLLHDGLIGGKGDGAGEEGGYGGRWHEVKDGASIAAPAYRKASMVAEGSPEMTSCVAMHVRTSSTRRGLIVVCLPTSSATAPATCGVAIDVPEIVRVALSELVHAAVIELPGAWMSTHEPWLEKEDLASLLVVDPTVMASGADAGLLLQASPLSLPAATTTTTPASWAARTARLTASERPPPRDIEMTAGVPAWLVVASVTDHSMAARMPE